MSNFNIITEALCLLIAIFCLHKSKGSFWWLFIPFLAVTLLIEILASYAFYSNGWLYNLYVLLQFVFLSYFFYQVNGSATLKRVIQLLAILYIIFVGYAFVFLRSFYHFDLLLFTLDCFLTVLFAIFFIFGCINERDRKKAVQQLPSLWITVGVVLFFSLVSIIFNAYDFIRTNNLKVAGLYIDNVAPQVLSLFMYSCFSYAFYQWKILQVK